MRAVIYGRYPSDLQREASIEDQVEVCRRYAQAHGWRVTGMYSDAALSGQSRFRPGFQKLLAHSGERVLDGPDRAEAMAAIRAMIERVELTPGPDRKVAGHGAARRAGPDLPACGAACSNAKKPPGGAAFDADTVRSVKLVAGTRNHRELTLSCTV